MLQKYISPLFEQTKQFERAHVSYDQFISENQERLGNLLLGTSFSPEELQWQYYRENEKVSQEKILKALEIIVCDLCIRDIRLGIRWSNVVNSKGEFDFSYYKPCLDYCFKNNVRICLNVGPIKTFRWPEDHVPSSVLEKIDVLPSNKSVIFPSSPLGKEALSYLYILLNYLKTSYSEHDLSKITIIQPENEPFNSFGIHSWVMSNEYMFSVIDKVHEYFPHTDILVNSAGVNNLKRITGIYKHIVERDEKMKGKLISGFDYYYLVPPFSSLPFIGKLDPISFSSLFGKNQALLNIQNARKIGYKIEVTEAQMEPWGRFISPGSSLHELQFVLLRSMEHILDMSHKSVVRLWGVELLAKHIIDKKLSKEQDDIIYLIKKINDSQAKS